MDRQLFEDREVLLLQQNRLIWGGFFIVTFLLLLSVVFMAKQKNNEKVIVVPPQLNSQFWVSQNAVDETYLMEMARYYATTLLNVTPKSIAYTTEQLLKVTSPKAFGQVSEQLKHLQNKLKQEQVATTFYPHFIEVDNGQLQVRLTGQLMVILAERTIVKRQATYQINFEHLNGRLLLAGFSERKEADDE